MDNFEVQNIDDMIEVSNLLKSSLKPISLLNYGSDKNAVKMSKDLFYHMENSEALKALEEAAKKKEKLMQNRMKRLK